MSDSASVFNQPAASSLPTENVLKLADPPPGSAEGRKKQQPQQPRQLLSCTKCRERKVKCDRTKPCSACCARGAPKECHFLVAEGGDYTPIQQSYELRKLRAENLKLKERLRAGKTSMGNDECVREDSPDLLLSDGSTTKPSRKATKQRRFKGQERSDSIYFGSPGLADVLHEFKSHFNLEPQTLAHAMPRGAEIYAPRDLPPFPFATMWRATLEECIPDLLDCLPPKEELMNLLEAFETRVQICSFPHVPNEITKAEVDRFMSDSQKNAEMFPDMLALLFAALALGSQHCVFDKCGGRWVEGAVEKESKKGDVYIAASMQALRMASFMNRPTLLAIQTLIMIGPYLTNSGRFLDAWTLFGTTIRLAHSIGLHRHPKVLDPAPPLREAMLRRTLWWWMLHMDQQYSMTLGRPLGISGIGDCPPPDDLTTDPTVLRFSEYVNKFTLLARQILSSDRLNNTKIDEFTDELRKLWDTVPEMLQFDETWLHNDREIPEWPVNAMAAVFYSKTHNYLILLNRQRIDNSSPLPKPSTYPSLPNTQQSHHPSNLLHRGRPLVLSSSMSLLSAFCFFYARAPAALICWTIGQQAFNSCMILLLDAMETGDTSRIQKVERAYAVFVELERKGVHKLAALAVERISWGLSVLRKRKVEQRQRTRPVLAGTAKRGTGDVEMQEATNSGLANETLRGAKVPIDTVMGNTGMLLLEDPGLQCFVPEAFEPLTWKFGGHSLHGVGMPKQKQEEQDRHKSQRQGPQKQGEREHEANQGRSSSISMSSVPSGQPTAALTKQGFRSGDGMTGGPRPPQGSAPPTYATFYTAPSHGSPDKAVRPQPQGLVSPMFPLSGAFTGVVQQDNLPQKAHPPPGGPEMDQHDSHTLRHHHYAPTGQPLPSYMAHSHASLPTAQTSAYPSPMPTQLTDLLDSAVISHASSMGEQITQPVYYTQQIAQSVHPSWAARPAMTSSVSTPMFSNHQGYEYGTSFGPSAEAMTHSAQELDVENWKRYLGGVTRSG